MAGARAGCLQHTSGVGCGPALREDEGTGAASAIAAGARRRAPGMGPGRGAERCVAWRPGCSVAGRIEAAPGERPGHRRCSPRWRPFDPWGTFSSSMATVTLLREMPQYGQREKPGAAWGWAWGAESGASRNGAAPGERPGQAGSTPACGSRGRWRLHSSTMAAEFLNLKKPRCGQRGLPGAGNDPTPRRGRAGYAVGRGAVRALGWGEGAGRWAGPGAGAR